MKILKTIKEQDVNSAASVNEKINYVLRRAARAVVFDEDNKVALLNVTKRNYYKLPGGGIEGKESIIEALKRERV